MKIKIKSRSGLINKLAAAGMVRFPGIILSEISLAEKVGSSYDVKVVSFRSN